MTVFPDTNVWLSAFFSRGLCAELLARLLQSEHRLLVGEPVEREFTRVARDTIGAAPADLSYALEVMHRQVVAPAVPNRLAGVPDPDDAPIIACAMAAGAGCFVTGDRALLDLVRIEDMAIVTPRQCWQALASIT